MTDDFDEQSGLPTTNRDQSCAFCGIPQPRFVHRLDPKSVRFRVYAKERTLLQEEQDTLVRQATLAAFRAADLGTLPISDA